MRQVTNLLIALLIVVAVFALVGGLGHLLRHSGPTQSYKDGWNQGIEEVSSMRGSNNPPTTSSAVEHKCVFLFNNWANSEDDEGQWLNGCRDAVSQWATTAMN
jgi:hypothetical protein